MSKLTLTVLVIALTMGLSACSSSHNSLHSSDSKTEVGLQKNQANSQLSKGKQQETQKNSTSNVVNKTQSNNLLNEPNSYKPLATPAQSLVDDAIPTTGKFNGIAYEFKSSDENDKIVNPKVHQLSTDDINVLNINGKRIDIAPEGVNLGYTYLNKDGEIRLSTGAFVNGVVFQDSMQNGIYQSKKDGKTYVYIQGELTPTDNIPKSGTARYTGLSSYHVNNNTLYEGSMSGNPPRFGIVGVDMIANFDDKNVKGSLLHTSDPNNVVAELEGKITGNQFSGTKDNTQLRGAFFGEKANEMGGIYVNEEKGFSGAFSAKSKW